MAKGRDLSPGPLPVLLKDGFLHASRVVPDPDERAICGNRQSAISIPTSSAMMPCTVLVGWTPSQKT